MLGCCLLLGWLIAWSEQPEGLPGLPRLLSCIADPPVCWSGLCCTQVARVEVLLAQSEQVWVCCHFGDRRRWPASEADPWAGNLQVILYRRQCTLPAFCMRFKC